MVYHPSRGCILESKITANRMFVMLDNIVMQSSTCINVHTDEIGDLWHKRYGHLSYANLWV